MIATIKTLEDNQNLIFNKIKNMNDEEHSQQERI